MNLRPARFSSSSTVTRASACLEQRKVMDRNRFQHGFSAVSFDVCYNSGLARAPRHHESSSSVFSCLDHASVYASAPAFSLLFLYTSIRVTHKGTQQDHSSGVSVANFRRLARSPKRPKQLPRPKIVVKNAICIKKVSTLLTLVDIVSEALPARIKACVYQSLRVQIRPPSPCSVTSTREPTSATKKGFQRIERCDLQAKILNAVADIVS
jgi:hypothetical protein